MPDGVGIKNEHSNTAQMTFPAPAPTWQMKSGRRPSIEELGRDQSLEELCSTAGMAKPVYDIEAVGDQVTMCCMAGTVKQTASGWDKQEAKAKHNCMPFYLLYFELFQFIPRPCSASAT